MKKTLLLILFSLCFVAFSQESEDSDDDIDSIFETAEDITAEENDKINGTPAHVEQKLPVSIKLYGNLDSEIGLCFTQLYGNFGKDKSSRYVSEYFNFKNDFSMVSRVDNNFAIHGTVRTEFFPIEWAKVREIYFDYMAGQYLLVSAGKKITNWGYVRVFNNEDDYEDVDQRLTTNIVADSINCISGVITIPFSFVTLTAIGLYNPSNHTEYTKNNPPKMTDISFAGSIEFTFWQTSLNLFGRRTAPSEVSFDGATGKGITNVLGWEIKRSIFSYDCYVQNTCQIGGIDDRVKGNILTAGFYRIWDNAAVNIEVQDVYRFDDKNTTLRFAADLGFRRIGPKKNLKLGIQWRHDSTFDLEKIDSKNVYDKNETCWVKIGLIKSNVFPHVDWKNGIEVLYDPYEYPYVYKARLGSIMKLKIDY